ncbi:ligase-associated DNA damage response DEXH box helicase [Sphingopyxis yananensis]|uniref:ligase-associated DNA damage response DEXH box helicase n=1 Tax=Sphingopyxis yananensis TaxID=2886687 RepID=UPI001D1038B7|nr:ligase-associated DNA damage response DEXH box helicase [Sphingopyxis yananensis]MCC2601072.1 ligase-associated DNA damage response DEXH box helicase [Sphingopyxis yananensis]
MTDLPPIFQNWFTAHGWTPHPFQLELLNAKGSQLLIAPTGGGKTLAGFLPSLVDLYQNPTAGLHTLYISPLKALASDVARNLSRPIAEMGLKIAVDQRTGDTKASRRARQKSKPPHMLLTTPESLALLISDPRGPWMFESLQRIVIDELHALAESKRGDQLMLCLSRITSWAPNAIIIGLSATTEAPRQLADFMGGAQIVRAPDGPKPDIALLPTNQPPPWSGQNGRYAVQDVLVAVKEARSVIIFLNTRAQAELFFQALWLVNDDHLPIALHHGSLSREQRERVEQAMSAGELRAVVATASLDLGLDWGNVDLVIQVGNPRQIKRLVQRIGRANHQYNQPSRARLLPTNRFDVIECTAAIEAVMDGELDGEPRANGPLDVLCQHILLIACAGPFDADVVYDQIISTGPYRDLSRTDFNDCLDYAATGGYVLRHYENWQRLVQRNGQWQLRDPRTARAIRMNSGTIIARDMMKVRTHGRSRRYLGEVEESFAAQLTPGDTFLLGGKTLRYDRTQELTLEVTPQADKNPKIAVYGGQTMASSVQLSQRVFHKLAAPESWTGLPNAVQQWLVLQAKVSSLPKAKQLLCEAFRYKKREHLVIYGFAGKNAHQTLGILLTHRMEEAGLAPLGFLAVDHALLLTSLHPATDLSDLFRLQDMDPALENWLANTSLYRRSFRAVAMIAGLIHRNHMGSRKTGKQTAFSSDILYDTLRKHEPHHLLLRAAARDARNSLAEWDRLSKMVDDFPEIKLVRLDRVSPLAAPLLMEFGRVRLFGEGSEELARRMADDLMQQSGISDIFNGV